jgi:hypothetical protein
MAMAPLASLKAGAGLGHDPDIPFADRRPELIGELILAGIHPAASIGTDLVVIIVNARHRHVDIPNILKPTSAISAEREISA